MDARRGMTVVEVLTIIAIAALILSLASVNFTALALKAKVDYAASEILRAGRDTRNRSISASEYAPGIFPSYGLYFDVAAPHKLTIYADCRIDDNGDLAINEQDDFTFAPSSANCNGTNGFVEEIFLLPVVEIKEIRSVFSGSSVTESKTYIEYLRPEPSTWITESDGSLLTAGRIEIEVGDVGNRFRAKIIFWSTGHIEIIENGLPSNYSIS